MWKSGRRLSYIPRLRISHQDLVWLPFLLGQKGNRLGEDRDRPRVAMPRTRLVRVVAVLSGAWFSMIPFVTALSAVSHYRSPISSDEWFFWEEKNTKSTVASV